MPSVKVGPGTEASPGLWLSKKPFSSQLAGSTGMSPRELLPSSQSQNECPFPGKVEHGAANLFLRAGYSQPPNPRVMNLLTSKKINTHPQASISQTNLPHRSLPTAWAGRARQKQGTMDNNFLFFLTYFYSVCEEFACRCYGHRVQTMLIGFLKQRVSELTRTWGLAFLLLSGQKCVGTLCL